MDWNTFDLMILAVKAGAVVCIAHIGAKIIRLAMVLRFLSEGGVTLEEVGSGENEKDE